MGNQSGVAETLKNRVSFVEIDQETLAALDEYGPALKAALPGILAEFYTHVAKWPNLAGMFKDQSRMDYARSAQERHWTHLFDAKFDAEYESSVKKIGLVHSRIGLEPTWYIGAYAFTLNRLYRHAATQYKSHLSPV